MLNKSQRQYSRGWRYAQFLFGIGLIALAFWVLGVLSSLVMPQYFVPADVPDLCSTDADCAARYPDFEAGPDVEYIIDAQTDVDQ